MPFVVPENPTSPKRCAPCAATGPPCLRCGHAATGEIYADAVHADGGCDVDWFLVINDPWKYNTNIFIYMYIYILLKPLVTTTDSEDDVPYSQRLNVSHSLMANRLQP